MQHREMHRHRYGTSRPTLNELSVGSSAKIVSVQGQGALRDRLLDMGLTPGTSVLVRKVAPMGDPIELTLRGYELTLRRSEAMNIEIEGEEYDHRVGGEPELRKDDAVQSADGVEPTRGKFSWCHRGAKGRRHPRA